MTEFIHSCGYHCRNPTCVLAQRDELVAKYVAQPVQPVGEATIAMLMKSADRYAHVYSFVADDTMPKMRAGLEADIRAALAQPVEAQLVPLTQKHKQTLVGNYFDDGWAKRAAEFLIQEVEEYYGIKPADNGDAA